jgi:hypothetical protein
VQAFIDRLLDDPDNRWMRTDNSKISNPTVTKAEVERRLEARKQWADLT